jgi:hypothetical protein
MPFIAVSRDPISAFHNAYELLMLMDRKIPACSGLFVNNA